MTTYFIRVLIPVLLLMQVRAYSQNTPSIRWEPSLSFTKKVNSRWSYNFTFRSRQQITEYGTGQSHFKTDRWDGSAMTTYSLFKGRKLSIGYMHRTDQPLDAESGSEHRISQQFAFIINMSRYRIGNKVLIEERIQSERYETRLRYGISADFPLQGKKLDPRELYFITGNEWVYAFNKFGDELENRFNLGVGWLLKNGQKLQLVAESRFRDMISVDRNHIIQIKSIYYFNF